MVSIAASLHEESGVWYLDVWAASEKMSADNRAVASAAAYRLCFVYIIFGEETKRKMLSKYQGRM